MIVLLDLAGAPVQMIKQSVSNDTLEGPVYFHAHARLVKGQPRHAPVLLMTEADWEWISDEDVTHAGAFGDDFAALGETKALKMKTRLIEFVGDDPRHHDEWIVVWKFPSDLNFLEDDKGRRILKPIHDIALPVGEYPLLDDGWFPRDRSHPSLPKKKAVQKMRIDVPGGESVHYLEHEKTGTSVAAITSRFFIRELWKITPKEIKTVVRLLQDLYSECGVYAFPCWGQHHVIVLYIDVQTDELITPKHMARLLADKDRKVQAVLQKHASSSVGSWVRNYIRLAESKPYLQHNEGIHSPKPTQSTVQSKRVLRHPTDSTGTLLRANANNSQTYISDVPVPNDVVVSVLKNEGEFSLIRYEDTMQGYVRTKYLHPSESKKPKPTSPASSSSTNTLHLCTYNCLYTEHAKSNKLKTSVFESETVTRTTDFSNPVAPENIQWKTRLPRIVSNLKMKGTNEFPDVILLQETSPAMRKQIMNMMPDHYKHAHSDFGTLGGIVEDGFCHVLWNSQRFKLISKTTSTSKPGQRFVGVHIRSRESPQVETFVASVHLPASGSAPVQPILDVLKPMVSASACAIIGGDFNVEMNPFSPTFQTLTGNDPTFYNDETSKFDWIVGTRRVVSDTYHVNKIVKKEGRWPNENEGSDHTCLHATVMLQ